MNRLGWVLLVCILGLGSYSGTRFSPQETLNAMLAGPKAFWSFFEGSSQIQRLTKFGFNKDIDTGSREILASFGGTWLQRELAAETLSVVSTSASDTAAGIGAQQLLLSCINSDGLEVNVVVALNGLTPVVTTQTCKFINRAVVFLTGTSDTNVGNINITQSTSSVQLAQIPAARSSTQQLLYYVPADRRCYMDHVFIKVRKLAGGSDPKVEINALIYSQTQDTVYDVREFYIDTSSGDGIIDLFDFKAEVLRPNEIITFDFLTDTNNTIATGSIDMTCKID